MESLGRPARRRRSRASPINAASAPAFSPHSAASRSRSQEERAGLSPLVETYDAEMLSIYAKACGWVLAREHAKAGDLWMISGYLGASDEFDDAMGKLALAYADQAERDHTELQRAVRAGTIEVQMER